MISILNMKVVYIIQSRLPSLLTMGMKNNFMLSRGVQIIIFETVDTTFKDT